MPTAWATAGGGLVPQPLQPSKDGLVLWVKGDAGLITPTSERVETWENQHGLNDGFSVGAPYPSDAPYALTGDTIDGVQLVTFGVGVDANKGLRTGAPNPGAASNLVDRVGAPMDGAHARTWLAMLRPDWQASFARLGGNPLAQSTYGAIFSIWGDAAPENGTAWSHAWQSIDVKWSTPLGPGSVYNGVPTLVEWTTTTWPAFEFRVNNVLVATVPADLSTWTPGAVGPLFLAGPGNPSFLGGTTELLCYDVGISTAQRQKNTDYMVSRYPSAPIVH